MNAAVSSTTGHPQGAARSVRQFDYIAEMMQLALDDTPVLKIKGRVTQVIGTIIKAVVPTVKVGEVCVLKNHATQTMQFCADTAVQILGGMGFMRGTLSERIYREVKVLTIGGGTEEIMKELAARQWRRLCVELRPLWRQARLLLLGHALLEKLVSPRKSITAHVYQARSAIDNVVNVDDELARDLTAPWLAAKPFCPLPVLGVPGWWPANEAPGFYDDAQVFRPLRAAPVP